MVELIGLGFMSKITLPKLMHHAASCNGNYLISYLISKTWRNKYGVGSIKGVG